MKIAALRTSPEIKLVSPAVSHDLNWLKVSTVNLGRCQRLTMQRFMDLLPTSARPDYIAVHVYSTTFEAFRARVEEFWNTFHLPIWVTEFAMTVSLSDSLIAQDAADKEEL